MTDQSGPVRVRLAPSPTGAPHVGTAYIGLFDYVLTRQAGGEFLLRIEDTDRERSTPESEAAIMESLRWVGLQWDEGPDVGGDHGPYRQSERSALYREHAQRLLDAGVAYRCFCKPEDLAARRKQRKAEGGSSFGYDRLCRDLPEEKVIDRLEAGQAHVVRLKVPLDGETSFQDAVRGTVTVPNADIDDQVLLKSDGFPTYHLANVVDDRLMGITHVIRAEEWISSTPKHILLYKAFGWEPPAFFHMPLLRNADKSKISKRKNPVSLLWYREQGYLPEALLNFLALMGWSMGEDQEVFSLDEMIERFSWERVKTSGPVFDLQKLEWLNGEYIRAMSVEQLLERLLAEPFTCHTDQPADLLLKITRLVQERLKLLADFDGLTGFFFAREPYDPADLVPRKTDGEFVRTALPMLRQAFESLAEWTLEPMEAVMPELVERLGCKRGSLFMLLRVAVTCRKVSTPLFETMEVLGRQECLERIDDAIAHAGELP